MNSVDRKELAFVKPSVKAKQTEGKKLKKGNFLVEKRPEKLKRFFRIEQCEF